jgi:hypothetical protein
MKRMRTVEDSDSATSESDVENSYNTDNEVETDSVSESDSDNVDDTSSEVGDEYESDPWAPLKAEATQQSLSEFEKLTQNFKVHMQDKAYLLILPKLRKDLQNIHLERLLWIRQLKRDPIHKKIMETRDVFVNDDNFDHREALDAAIDKRKFLLKRLFRNTRYRSDIDS